MPTPKLKKVYDRPDSDNQQREDIFTYAAYRRELSGWAQEWVERARAETGPRDQGKASKKASRLVGATPRKL